VGGDQRIRWEAARAVADALLHYLAPVCERVEVAGSLRRRKEYVGDIEIVAIPKTKREPDMFGAPSGPEILLIDDAIAAYNLHESAGGAIELIAAGDRYWKLIDTAMKIAGHDDDGKTLSMERKDGRVGLQIDLFLVRPPAQWGPIFAIRTGSGDFSKKMMIALKARGYRCEDGRVLDRRGVLIDCPEERDFFAVAGVKWVEPEKRR
jgi:DNA polymerase/3'-5' exonuclease PolX